MWLHASADVAAARTSTNFFLGRKRTQLIRLRDSAAVATARTSTVLSLERKRTQLIRLRDSAAIATARTSNNFFLGRNRTIHWCLAISLAVMVACTPAATPRPTAQVSGEVVVFAASSLTDAFQDIGASFQQAHPGVKVTFNFGASSQLVTQLGQGASADVFASADTIQMDNAKKAGSVSGQDHVFAGNRLVLITPKDNPGHVGSVKDLANRGVKFVTAQPGVPIGQYTLQLLDKASADPNYGTDFKSWVVGNTVSQEDNVRQVVSKVQLGEADAAIVYSTDATPQVRDQLNLIQIPDALQTLAAYPIALAKGNNPAGGGAFMAYVLGPDGEAALAKWGFLPPPSQ